MNEPQSVAAEMIALSLLAGENSRGCPLLSPSDLFPVSVADSALWPPASSVNLLSSFTIPQGQALLWTYVSLYTTLADESTAAVNYGFNYKALAKVQYRSSASASSNYTDLTTQVQAQSLFNKPILVVFPTATVPRIVLYPNSSTQTANSLRVLAEFQGYLIPSSAAAIFANTATQFS